MPGSSELSLSHLKSQKTLWRQSRDVDQSRETFKSHIKAKPEHIGISLPNASIIHAFNLAQKRFFQPVNSQKPCMEWSTCRPDHPYK